MRKFIFGLMMTPLIGFTSVEVGTGYTSAYSGRKVTTLALASSTSNYALSTYMAGVRNDYYYQSSYGLNFFSMRNNGSLMGGPVQGGFGLGLLYSQSGFKDSDDSKESTNSDFLIGPAFRLNWSFFNNFYLNIDATYGIRDISSHIQMNFQDSVSTSIGFRL